MSEITVGILSPSPEHSESLRAQLNATGLATVRVEVDEYCVGKGDLATRRLVESRPDIVLVDMQDRTAALQSLQVLHSALPESWLFVSSDDANPQVIIESMRHGAREFLPKPVTNRGLHEALSRFKAERQKLRTAWRAGKMYWVAGAKSGAGATSVAINTAVALGVAPGLKVGLIDLNLTGGDIGAFLNIKAKYTVADALASASRLDSMLLDSYTQPVHGISILTGVQEFQPGRTVPAPQLARLLEVSSETYTHCFFDFPVTADRDNWRLAAEMSSEILIVLTPDLPSISRGNRLIRFFEGNDRLGRIRLILNRSSRADEIRDAEIAKAVNHPVFWKLPNDDTACAEAINCGVPAVTVDSNGLARSYREFAQQLAGAALPEKRRGLLKLFS